jgi:hypothetical protein
MYNIDYNQKVIETLVPDKRQPKTTAYLQQLAREVSQNHSQLTKLYKQYQLADNWTNVFFPRNSVVRYAKAIYVAVEDTTDEPTYSNAWLLVSPNFMGNDFRLAIRGERLILDYALNTWFNTTFRQLPATSDIYLVTNTITESAFVVGSTEFESSNIFQNVSSQFVINSYSFANQYNLTIKIPIAVFNALGTTDEIRKSIIKNFADLYISAGMSLSKGLEQLQKLF